MGANRLRQQLASLCGSWHQGQRSPELSAAQILAFPLPWGEGQGEGRFARSFCCALLSCAYARCRGPMVRICKSCVFCSHGCPPFAGMTLLPQRYTLNRRGSPSMACRPVFCPC